MLKQAPATFTALRPLFSSRHHAFLSLFELAQAFHFFENVFEEILATHDVQVAFYLRVFFGEAVDFFLREVAAEAGVKFARKLWCR